VRSRRRQFKGLKPKVGEASGAEGVASWHDKMKDLNGCLNFKKRILKGFSQNESARQHLVSRKNKQSLFYKKL
jgi:hypothetical protein